MHTVTTTTKMPIPERRHHPFTDFDDHVPCARPSLCDDTLRLLLKYFLESCSRVLQQLLGGLLLLIIIDPNGVRGRGGKGVLPASVGAAVEAIDRFSMWQGGRTGGALDTPQYT